MSQKRTIVVNTLANGAAQATAMVAALVFMPFLITRFGATNYGLYLIAASIGGYAAILDFGVGASLTKLIAERSNDDDREHVAVLASSALAFYLVIGVIVCAIMLVLAFSAGAFFKVDADGARLLRNMFLVAAASSLITWPATTANHVLAGFQRYTVLARTAAGVTLGTVAVMTVVVITRQGPLVLMAGNALVAITGGLINVVLARAALHGASVSPQRADPATMRTIFSFSWAIFIVQVMTVILYQQTDRLVLGVALGAIAVTLYEGASKFQGFISQLVTFANSASMPVASKLEAEGRAEAIQTLFLRGTKYVLVLTAPVVVTLMVIAEPLLRRWLGASLATQGLANRIPEMALAAQILISHQILTAGGTLGDSMIIGMGKLPKRLPYAIVVTLANLVLSVLLVRPLGILGVVIGTTLPYLVDFPIHMWLLFKLLGVQPRRWVREVVAPVYPLLVLPLAMSIGALYTPLSGSLIGMAVIGAASVGAYWAAVMAFSMSPVERVEIRAGIDAVRNRLGRPR